MELNTEDERHLGVMGLNMDAVADATKDAGGDLDSLRDLSKVVVGELKAGLLGVGFDGDWYLDGAFELVELGCVLRLGKSELVASDPVDDEAVLCKDVLGLSSFTKVVIAKVDTTSVDRHAAGEALVLGKVSLDESACDEMR